MTPPVFRILGPLEVERENRVVALGRRERALLGVLLLYAGEVVSVERLIDGVWGDVPPASAKHMVHEYVSRLRQALGDASRIVTRVPGYIAVCHDDELDARCFSTLTEAARTAARAGEHEEALQSYDAALKLWHGDALAGAELEGQARNDAAHLDQERLLVKEERIDSALALGRHRELIPELERHVRDEPLRERPRAQLMLALYRSGRQTDALEHYRQARAQLVEHAGIEPGHELAALERAILQHDPALELAAAPASAGEEPRPPELQTPSRNGRRRILAAAGMLAVAGVGALAWLTLAEGDDAGSAAVEGNSVAVIDPDGGRRTASIPVAGGPAAGPSPSAVTAGADSIWVANLNAHTVSRIDPATHVVVQTIPVGHGPAGVAFGAGFVWVTDGLDGTVSKIDPRTNTRVQTIRVGNAPSGIAAGAHDVWVANSNDRSVTRIDAATGTPRKATAVPSGADGVALGAGSVWVTGHSTGLVTRIDRRSGRVLGTARAGNGATAATVGADSVWVANSLDGTVTRIDPVTGRVSATIPVGDGPSGLVARTNGIWVSNEQAGTLMQIDPARNTVVKTVPIGNRPVGVAASPDALFVAVRASGEGHYGGTLTVLAPVVLSTPDPGQAYIPHDVQLIALTNDGLVGLRRVGGSAGAQLVPDLAVSLPAPTDRGRTYRFQLRPGRRYSTGAVVRPADFRRGIERTLALSVTGEYFSHIVGARACLAHRKRTCDLSRGIETDAASNTVVFHLTTPDPEFPAKLTLPGAYAVPDGTPVRVTKPLPATGPYMFSSFDPEHSVRLVRNPHFHEWSRVAQPRGFPDEIVERFGGSPDAHVAAVLRGEADMAEDISRASPRVQAAMQTQHASQLEFSPAPVTHSLVLNTRVPPFDDVNVRRALNYALDRKRLRDLTTGAQQGDLTCQILPPNVVGYRRYCPYTAPSASGAWRAPDMARARRLVRASGTAGQAVTVWMPTWLKYRNAEAARYVASVLDRLGYEARYRVSDDPYTLESLPRVQLGFFGWGTDYPTTYSFLFSILTCAANHPETSNDLTNISQFCDPAIDAKIERAASIQASDPEASSRLWAEVDHAIVDQAPWVAYSNWVKPEFLSPRVGNYQHHPQWGTLLGQLWVR